jgi:hypothetical protein
MPVKSNDSLWLFEVRSRRVIVRPGTFVTGLEKQSSMRCLSLRV